MRRLLTATLLATVLLSFSACRQIRINEHEEWGALFKKHGVTDGCIIIRDHAHEQLDLYNKDRCLRRYSPASTFKIFNALVGLETGAVKDETTVIPWDGVVRDMPEWNKDLTMLQAFKVSAVPYFQEVARRNGAAVLQKAMDTVRYGNMRIGPAVDQFWLNDTLQISADEQIGFLRKLYFDELPFTERSQRIVRFLMMQEDTPEYKLAYKTGWSKLPGKPDVLWVVGWADRIEHMKEHKNSTNVSDVRNYPYFFAMNFTAPDSSDRWVTERIALLKDLLRADGAIE